LVLVHLERSSDIRSDNLSDDNSTDLVDEVVGCKDRSIDLSVLDSEGSSRPKEVEGNSSSRSRERSTGDRHIVGSSEVDNPSCIRVTSRDGDPSVLSDIRGG